MSLRKAFKVGGKGRRERLLSSLSLHLYLHRLTTAESEEVREGGKDLAGWGNEGRNQGDRPFPFHRAATSEEKPRRGARRAARLNWNQRPLPLFHSSTPLPVFQPVPRAEQILTILAFIRSGGRYPLRFRRHMRVRFLFFLPQPPRTTRFGAVILLFN